MGAIKKRVLLVDDAVVVRKVLSQAIGQDPALEVAATAVNGRIGLTKFAATHPDIVLLDIEMPEMDGLETVRELRKIDARVPIIMFSSLTERGASVTLEALALGATDYVTKPSNIDGAATLDAITRDLIPKIGHSADCPVHAAASCRRSSNLGPCWCRRSLDCSLLCRLSRSAFPRVGLMPLPGSCPPYPLSFRCLSSSPSTCRPSLPPCWRPVSIQRARCRCGSAYRKCH